MIKYVPTGILRRYVRRANITGLKRGNARKKGDITVDASARVTRSLAPKSCSVRQPGYTIWLRF